MRLHAPVVQLESVACYLSLVLLPRPRKVTALIFFLLGPFFRFFYSKRNSFLLPFFFPFTWPVFAFYLNLKLSAWQYKFKFKWQPKLTNSVLLFADLLLILLLLFELYCCYKNRMTRTCHEPKSSETQICKWTLLLSSQTLRKLNLLNFKNIFLISKKKMFSSLLFFSSWLRQVNLEQQTIIWLNSIPNKADILQRQFCWRLSPHLTCEIHSYKTTTTTIFHKQTQLFPFYVL